MAVAASIWITRMPCLHVTLIANPGAQKAKAQQQHDQEWMEKHEEGAT